MMGVCEPMQVEGVDHRIQDSKILVIKQWIMNESFKKAKDHYTEANQIIENWNKLNDTIRN